MNRWPIVLFARLTAALEAHLDYEEQQLLPVMDRL